MKFIRAVLLVASAILQSATVKEVTTDMAFAALWGAIYFVVRRPLEEYRNRMTPRSSTRVSVATTAMMFSAAWLGPHQFLTLVLILGITELVMPWLNPELLLAEGTHLVRLEHTCTIPFAVEKKAPPKSKFMQHLYSLLEGNTSRDVVRIEITALASEVQVEATIETLTDGEPATQIAAPLGAFHARTVVALLGPGTYRLTMAAIDGKPTPVTVLITKFE